jgi:hypothetical protein
MAAVHTESAGALAERTMSPPGTAEAKGAASGPLRSVLFVAIPPEQAVAAVPPA